MSTKSLLVSLAAGIFAGGALFDAFPEAARSLGNYPAAIWFTAGFLAWWIIKLVLEYLKRPAFTALTASALWLHSVLEGAATGIAFGVSRTFGLFILGAMTLHILPEFFAATALLRGSGSTSRSSAWVAFAGFGLLYAGFGLVYWFLPSLGESIPIAIAISGGALTYVGLASFWKRRSMPDFVALLLGLTIILLQSRI